MKPGRPIVAFVEPEFLLRVDGAKAIDEAGYNVISAASGSEALQILRDRPNVDLLLTEVALPGGMDGFTLAEEARAVNPAIRLLYIGNDRSKFHGTPRERHLVKPYSSADLIKRIAATLA